MYTELEHEHEHGPMMRYACNFDPGGGVDTRVHQVHTGLGRGNSCHCQWGRKVEMDSKDDEGRLVLIIK